MNPKPINTYADSAVRMVNQGHLTPAQAVELLDLWSGQDYTLNQVVTAYIQAEVRHLEGGDP